LNPIKEKVHTNLLQIQKLPATIKKFKFGRIPTEERIAALEQMWAFYTKDKQSVYSFHSPPQNEADKLLINSDGLESTQAKKIGEIPTSNIIKFLIVRSLENACLKKGLVRRSNEIPHRRHLYFPLGLLEKEKFHFTGYNNKKTYVQVAGTRTKTGQPYKYHLSPRFAVQLEKDVSFVRLNIQNHITQDDGTEFSGRSAMSRRKSLSKGLWNHQWLQRYFAVASFLSDGKETITLGETVEEQVILGSKFYFAEAPVGIREDLLPHNLEPLELDQDEEQAGTEAHSEDGN
jgi:hypothetical protein